MNGLIIIKTCQLIPCCVFKKSQAEKSGYLVYIMLIPHSTLSPHCFVFHKVVADTMHVHQCFNVSSKNFMFSSMLILKIEIIELTKLILKINTSVKSSLLIPQAVILIR